MYFHVTKREQDTTELKMSTIGTSLNEFIEELVYVKKHLLSMHCIQRIVLSSPGDAVITDLQSFCSGFSS